MDFIIGLPSSKGFIVIYVVINRLSKIAHFIPLKTDFIRTIVADVFIKNVLKIHGIPKSFISGRDKVFLSNFWHHLFTAMGTTLSMSSVYHPQMDGQMEASNKCIELYLHWFISEKPKRAQYWYITSLHSSAGMTSFQIVFGRDPPVLMPYYANENNPSEVSALLHQRGFDFG